MDQQRFDHLTRLLGASGTRRLGLRAALGGLLGLGLGAAAHDADARGKDGNRDKARKPGAAKRRHECGPDAPCPTGFDCVKQGRKRRCSCPTGVTCDGACCPTGQVCQNGECTVPTTCIAPGEPCKGVGKPCCDGRTCSSGQGGQNDIACYVHKTGACQSTADCVYGTACLDGRCAFDVPPPAATGASCNPVVGQQCEAPGATCVAYEGAGAPSGSFCTLPLNYTCTGDPDCTCYKCGWVAGDAASGGRREARTPSSGPRLACCGPRNYPCRTDRNCCLGNICVNGSCQPEACDVCASGCPYTTVNDAVAAMPAGSTIRVAPGVYQTSATVNHSLTIRACAGDPGVILQNLGGENQGSGPIFGSPSYLYAPATLTLLGLTLRTIPEFEGDSQAPGVELDGSDAGRFTLYAAGCTFEKLNPAIDLKDAADAVVTSSAFEGSSNHLIQGSHGSPGRCTFAATGSTFRNTAGSVMRFTSVDTTLTDCTVSGGATGTSISGPVLGGGIVFESNGDAGPQATLTLAGATRVTGNQSEYGGGIAMVSYNGGTASLVMTGNARVTGNTATAAADSGSGVFYWPRTDFGDPGIVTASGTAGRVSGNSGAGAQCAITTDPYVPGAFTPLPTCIP